MKKLTVKSTILVMFSMLLIGCSHTELPARKQSGENTVNTTSKEALATKLCVRYKDVSETYELKENATFEVMVLSERFRFTVDKIDKNEITIKADNYGLVKPNEDGTINLRAKEDTFVFLMGEELKLCAQVMDASFDLFITAE